VGGHYFSLTTFLLWFGQPVSGDALWLGLAVDLAAAWKLPDVRIWSPAMLGIVVASTFGSLALEWNLSRERVAGGGEWNVLYPLAPLLAQAMLRRIDIRLVVIR